MVTGWVLLDSQSGQLHRTDGDGSVYPTSSRMEETILYAVCTHSPAIYNLSASKCKRTACTLWACNPESAPSQLILCLSLAQLSYPRILDLSLAYTTPDIATPKTLLAMEGLYPQAHGATDTDCANGAIQDVKLVTSRIADLTMGFHGIYNRCGGTFPLSTHNP